MPDRDRDLKAIAKMAIDYRKEFKTMLNAGYGYNYRDTKLRDELFLKIDSYLRSYPDAL